VFAEAVEAEAFAGAVDFSIGADLGVAVLGGPFGDIGVEALAIANDGREEKEIAAFFHFGLEAPAELVAGLGFDGQLAIGAVLCAEAREEQADEMINLGDGGDGALAAAATVALLDADGGRDAGDEVHVRAGELLNELAGVDVHRIEEAALALGEKEVEGERAFAGTADAGDDDELVARDGEREVF